MRMIGRTAAFCCLACGVLTAPAAVSQTAVLCEWGKTSWRVVIPRDAPNDTRFAAHDLTNHLYRMTGIPFPLQEGGEGNEAQTIEVGTSRAKSAALAAAGRLENGESAAVLDGTNLFVWGAGKQGTANGVYVFLEDRLGCRWFTPWDEPHVPKRESIVLGTFADVNRPKLTERWILTIESTDQLHPDGMLFQYRNRLNALTWDRYHNVSLPPGCTDLRPEIYCPYPLVHSLCIRMPAHGKDGAKGDFDEHPEWFSMDAEGRRRDNWQMCFANRQLRDELTRRMLKAFDAVKERPCYLDLSQRDEFGDAFCLCPDCKAMAKRYGTPAAQFFDYLRELGNLLLRERPGCHVRFLAYRTSQTQIPPNESFGRFPDNLIPVFAPIEGDFSKDYLHPANATAFAHLKRWCAITHRTWTWYYPLPYGGTCPPYLAIGRWTKDLRLAAAAGLTGGCFEHDVGCPSGLNFTDLQAWLMAKLYEHPEKDVGPLIVEFCRNQYGAAAGDVLAYLRELETMSREYGAFVSWDGSLLPLLTPERLMHWTGLFDAAEKKVADDPLKVQRLRECRAGVDIYALKRYPRLKASGCGIPPEVFRDRLTNMLERSYARRCPGKDANPIAPVVKWCNPVKDMCLRMTKKVESAYMTAAGGDVKLPEQFAGVPEADLHVVPNTGGDGGGKLEPKADAAYGFASSDAADSNEEEGFCCGFWDTANMRWGATRRIRPEDVRTPDKYEFYHIGVISLSPNCYVFAGSSCRVRSRLEDYYMPGEPEYWDLWVSLKFEGPRYRGSRASENRVWYDRLVLRRVQKP